MKRLTLLFALLILAAGGVYAQKIQKVDSRYKADLTVVSVEHEYQADLVVYVTDREYQAKANENKGIWFFTDHSYNADKKVYFTDNKFNADLKVYFTDRPHRAGWRKKEKQPLLY